MKFQTRFSNSVRGGFAAFLLVLSVGIAGCGGGGGGDEDPPAAPPAAALEGNWQLTVNDGEATSGPVTVPASAVPTAQQVERLTTEEVARQVATSNFNGYTVAIAGGNIHVTGPGTDFTVVINSFEAGGYQGCDPCNVGSRVAFDLTVNATHGGRIDGETEPTTTENVTLGFRFTRAN